MSRNRTDNNQEPPIRQVPTEDYKRFEDAYSERLGEIISETREVKASQERVDFEKCRVD